MGEVDQPGQLLAPARQRNTEPLLAPGAGAQRACEGRRRGRIAREYLHDTAGGIAIQLRQRSAQRFNAGGGIQAGGGRLALAVGHGGRYAIHQNPHAAHAEGGTGAESPYRELQVLGEILAVTRLQAGHGGQQFRQVDQWSRLVGGIDRH